jgi:hypothetical protein
MKRAKKDDDLLTLKYVPLRNVEQWARNTKKHDIQKIILSFERHGFKDPLKFEPALNNGDGGIVEGNGRDIALKTMFNQNPKKPPRGIIIQDKDWMVPVLFGVDARSQAAAESYGIDHNNLTMAGSDFEFMDVMKMWGDSTAEMLRGLGKANEMPVSVSSEDLDALLNAEQEKLSEREEPLREKNMLRILVSAPASLALDIQKHIDHLKEIPGVEVDIGGN